MSQTAALIHPPGGRKEGEEEEEVDQTAALIKFPTSGAQRVSVRLQEGGVPGGGNCFFFFFFERRHGFLRNNRGWRGWKKSLQSREWRQNRVLP